MRSIIASMVLLAAQGAGFSGQAAEFLKAEVKAADIRTGGELTGCSLEYSGVFADHIYRSGALSGVAGSLNILKLGKQSVGLFFKIGLVDWFDAELKQAKAAKIEKAYVKSGKDLAPEKRTPCDNPNGYCGGSGPDGAIQFLSSTVNNSIEIGLNRTPNGLDILLALPPADPGDDVKFFKCTDELLKSVLESIDEPKR